MPLNSLVEVFSSNDFQINLLAGLVIFVLDVVVILALIPWLLSIRERIRWRPARNRLLYVMHDKLHSINTLLFPISAHIALARSRQFTASANLYLAIDSSLQSLDDSIKALRQEVPRDIQIFSSSFDAEITKHASEFVVECDALLGQLAHFGSVWRRGNIVALSTSDDETGGTVVELSSKRLTTLIQDLQKYLRHTPSNATDMNLTMKKIKDVCEGMASLNPEIGPRLRDMNSPGTHPFTMSATRLVKEETLAAPTGAQNPAQTK